MCTEIHSKLRIETTQTNETGDDCTANLEIYKVSLVELRCKTYIQTRQR